MAGDAHAALRCGALCAACGGDAHAAPRAASVPHAARVDLFGEPAERVVLPHVQCPHCHRNVQAGRFAPHLEKCLGETDTKPLERKQPNRRITNDQRFVATVPHFFVFFLRTGIGRVSSRRRAAAPTSEAGSRPSLAPAFGAHLLSVSAAAAAAEAAAAAAATVAGASSTAVDVDDGDDDESFSESAKRKRKRVKRETAMQSLRSLSEKELRDILSSTCGCISATTGKMCTKAIKACKQHSDEQRSKLRKVLLESSPDKAPPQVLQNPNGSMDVFSQL